VAFYHVYNSCFLYVLVLLMITSLLYPLLEGYCDQDISSNTSWFMLNFDTMQVGSFKR
jgi:hypothetical protein